MKKKRRKKWKYPKDRRIPKTLGEPIGEMMGGIPVFLGPEFAIKMLDELSKLGTFSYQPGYCVITPDPERLLEDCRKVIEGLAKPSGDTR